jgi:putative 4-mercaptohistidine N1-methyltranferase
MENESKKLITACVVSAAVGYSIATLLNRRGGSSSAAAPAAKEDPKESRDIYEKQDVARQYMEFHFTPGSQSFTRSIGSISEAFDFPIRVAQKFAKYAPKSAKRALDLGCATGASVFEMSKVFDTVIGVDLSNAFISYANELKANGTCDYFAPDQGLTTIPRTTKIPIGSRPERCTFLVGDALNVDPSLGTFDGLLAANLLCRVPEPRMLLDSFARLINQGGILVLVSPYSWWEGATNKDKWIGGRPGQPRSEDQVKAILSVSFELVSEQDEPFLIRDHHRRFQLGFSHCTVWRRK